MSRYLAPAAIVDVNALSSKNAITTLVEIEVDTDPPTRLRVARARSNIAWGKHTYYGSNLELSPAEEDGKASFNEQMLTIQNVTREIGLLVEEHDGLDGQPVTIYKVLSSDLTSGQYVTKDEFRIIEIHMGDSVAVVRLGRANLWRATIPAKRIMRNGCAVQYKGPLCAYLGALTLCSKVRGGGTGCEAHAVDSTDHPARFNGAPLMPRLTGLGVKKK